MVLTLIQPRFKPCSVEPVSSSLALVFIGRHVTVEGVLDSYLAAILLTQQTPDNRALLIAQGVPRDIVGDCEKDERVKDDLELGAALGGEQGIEVAGSIGHGGGARR